MLGRLPGTHIPVFPPDHIGETRPDYADPAVEPEGRNHGQLRASGVVGPTVIPIPTLEVL
jgi:hypothetical protein